MTKWKRLRKLREKRRAEVEALRPNIEEKEAKPADPEKISDNIQHSQKTKKYRKDEPTRLNKEVFALIPRYIYLVAIFVLLSGVFFPLITPHADDAFIFVVEGAAILFLGLAGGILLFKAATSDKHQGLFLVIGFVLLITSIALIFMIQDWWKLEFFRG